MKLVTTNTWGSIPVNKLIVTLTMIGSLLVADVALAQEKQPAKQAFKSNNKTVKLNFEDELVTGKNARPEVEYIFEKSQFNFKKLIRLRDNFIPEAGKGREEFSEK